MKWKDINLLVLLILLLFIHPSVHPFVHSFVHSFVCLFIRLFFIHLINRWFMHFKCWSYKRCFIDFVFFFCPPQAREEVMITLICSFLHCKSTCYHKDFSQEKKFKHLSCTPIKGFSQKREKLMEAPPPSLSKGRLGEKKSASERGGVSWTRGLLDKGDSQLSTWPYE